MGGGYSGCKDDCGGSDDMGGLYSEVSEGVFTSYQGATGGEGIPRPSPNYIDSSGDYRQIQGESIIGLVV